ncbi:MAG: Putrescine transporter PotE [Chlamydiia bacterium]|nr:Putrescine transporter PotE [Chlamydiia bacterium]
MQSKRTRISELDKGAMKQVLSLSDVFAVGYGDLGSSIYYALGITVLYALGATPIALMIAGFVFACTALSYSEMSSMNRAAGGSQNFTRIAFNDLISFIAGWALLLDFIVTIAISSYSVAPYLSYFFPILKVTHIKIIFTICLIAALFCLNYFGTKHSTKLSWILTTLTIFTQAVIIIIGAIYLFSGPKFIEHLKIGGSNTLWSPSFKEFWKGTAMAMVAYTGIESMAQLTSETKNPKKTVPRAILLAMGLLIIMYFAVSTVALSAVNPEVLSHDFLEDPISGIISALPFGQKLLGPWVGALGAIILMVAANAGLMGASRLSFRMGEYYQLPRAFYKLHKKYKTPVVSLCFFGVLACIVVIWSRGRLAFLADLYNFGAMLAFFFSHLSLIILRFKMPDLERPFRIKFNIPIGKYRIPVTAVIGALACFCVWVLVIITKPEGRYLGIAWLIVGLVMYFVYRRRKRIAPAGKLEVEKISVPGFARISYKHILVPTRGGAQTETVQTACEIAKQHKSDITAIFIIQIPFSVSINTPLFHEMKEAESALKRAEAIAREFGVDIHTKIVRARSVPKAILSLLQDEQFDLLVLGATIPDTGTFVRGLGPIADDIIKDSPCRVYITCTRAEFFKHQKEVTSQESSSQDGISQSDPS